MDQDIRMCSLALSLKFDRAIRRSRNGMKEMQERENLNSRTDCFTYRSGYSNVFTRFVFERSATVQ